MVNNYAKAYTEVLEILSYFSKEEYEKIPEEKIQFFKENMDKDYMYTINPNISLSMQYISNEANAILITLYRDYFATEHQKEILARLLNNNQKKIDKAKRKMYNPDEIFHHNNTDKINGLDRNVELKTLDNKESFFKKFSKFIKNLLNLG